MTNPACDKDDEKPLDPAVEKVRRKMIRFMGVNLSLLFVALMAVVGAIVYKSRTAEPMPSEMSGLAVPSQGMIEGSIALPVGSRAISQSLSGERISILVEEADGKQVVYVFDMALGRMIGRFDIAPN